ncbi:Carboxypeptidase Q [Balamuthia mandrillaris]
MPPQLLSLLFALLLFFQVAHHVTAATSPTTTTTLAANAEPHNSFASAPSSNLKRLLSQVQDHQADANRLISQVTRGAAKHQAYNRLAEFTDTFGNRLCGSSRLERSIDYLLAVMRAEGLENVHGEEVTVPRWERGREHAKLIFPQQKELAMLGLGNSIATPKEGILAEAIVVSSFDELHALGPKNCSGKIVVFNQYCDWEKEPVACYGKTVNYRSRGATEASKVGALASLIRTVGGFSINSPHTGMQTYGSGVKPIPTACITIEDAEMLARMQARGQRIVIELYMEARTLPSTISRNIVAEIRGSTHPEEVVLVSGHIDSWDVGQGAMDDGGGAFISWQVLSLLKQLQMRPKRTVRLVMWTCEEFGGVGSHQYFQQHQSNASNYDLVMESDLGVFRPLGIEFTGSESAMKVMKQVGSLLKSINTSLVTTGGEGTDIGWWMNIGVPGASLANEAERYFWFHHSNGDTMTVLDPDDMDLCSATWAVTAFVVADLDDMLPRR